MSWKLNKKGDKFSDFMDEWDKHWSRFIDDLYPWRWHKLSHSFTNLWVEGARLSPYDQGHIVTFLVLGLVIVIGLVWYF